MDHNGLAPSLLDPGLVQQDAFMNFLKSCDKAKLHNMNLRSTSGRKWLPGM